MASPNSAASTDELREVVEGGEEEESGDVVVEELDFYEPLVLMSSSESKCGVQDSDPLVLSSTTGIGPSGLGVTDGHGEPSEEDNVSNITGSSKRRKKSTAHELRSKWNWWKVFNKLGTNDQCVLFAEDRGLIPTIKLCSYHRKPMNLNPQAGQLGIYRCRRTCRKQSVSRAAGTLFENAKLPLVQIFELMYAFCEDLSYEQTMKELSREGKPVLSAKTITDWFNYCRNTIIIYELDNQDNNTKIGGVNKNVQIYKSQFCKRNNSQVRNIEGHWVIGMIEDGSEDLRLEVCPENDSSAEILVQLIKKHVQEGSIIHTDKWGACLGLSDHGYIQKRIDPSDTDSIVAPDGIHTQRIKSQWKGLKKAFRQQNNKRDFTDWLVEYSWRRKITKNLLDPFEELLKCIKYVYKMN